MTMQLYLEVISMWTIAKVRRKHRKSFETIGLIRISLRIRCVDTEEASESEYGHATRPPNEPLEIKEL